jgi:hypothetical protein
MTENLNKDLRGEPSPKVLETLLKAASAKLGTDPETLRRSLENGSLEKSIKNAPADSEGMKKLKQALSDPKTARQLMNDPRAAEILKRAGGK